MVSQMFISTPSRFQHLQLRIRTSFQLSQVNDYRYIHGSLEVMIASVS
jgi:hypothetical protein